MNKKRIMIKAKTGLRRASSAPEAKEDGLLPAAQLGGEETGWMLVTRDHEMKDTHREEIKRTEVAILATAHNSSEDQDEWVAALINLKSRVLRKFKKRAHPWFGTFSRTAKLTIATIKILRFRGREHFAVALHTPLRNLTVFSSRV